MPSNKSGTAGALLVIDAQESFRHRADWPAINYPDIATRIGSLVGNARSRGLDVIWVLHSEPATGGPFDPALGHVKLLSGLEPQPDDVVLTKTSINAFTTTNLQQLFTMRGIRNLTICGIRTEQCCETTARVASDLGYDVDFIVDATATAPIRHRDVQPDAPLEQVLADPRTLSSEAVAERTVFVLDGRFAHVRWLHEVVT